MKKRQSFVNASDAAEICQWLSSEGILESAHVSGSHPERKAIARYLNKFADSVAQGYQTILQTVARRPNGQVKSKALTIPDDMLNNSISKQLQNEETLQGVLHLTGDHMALMFEVADELLSEKRYEEAANACLYLIYLNPYIASFWQQLGRCWIKMQRWQEALYAFCAAINCDPYNPARYRSAVNACLDWHHHDTAINLLSYGLHRLKGVNLPDTASREERFKDMLAYVVRHYQKGGR